MDERNANVNECWIHGEVTLKCITLFKKSKLSQRFCIDLVVNFVSQCASSCILEFVKKGRHLFECLASKYVYYDGAYVRQSGTDGAPIARILTVYQVLQGRRCYPININIKCNLLFSEHIKRVNRKGHMRKKREKKKMGKIY